MNNFLHSYKSLRKTVGWIGILLPFVLMIGGFCSEFKIQKSISDYYYTNMGDVFVGALCAVALFLFFYAGYDNLDNILGNFAGIFALGVAFFPTSQGKEIDIIGLFHLICAGSLFLILAVFSLFLFTRGEKNNKQKFKRNIIYIFCGVIIIASILSLFIYSLLTKNDQGIFIFIAESTSLLAFGVSWLTKGGDMFFPDKHKRKKPYMRKKYLRTH